MAVEGTCVAQGSDEQPVLRNRVYKFRHISATDAKQHLIDLGIGRNINNLPHNSIIVESDSPGELVKASSLLRMIDSEQPFVIKTILTSPDIQKMPRNDEIASELGDINIGTFKEPPTNTTEPSEGIAIVDIHDGDLIAVAPEPLFNRIADAIQRLQARTQTALEGKVPAEFAEPNALLIGRPEAAEALAEVDVGAGAVDANDKGGDTEKLIGNGAKAVEVKEKEDLLDEGFLEMMAEIEGKMAARTKQDLTEPEAPPVEVESRQAQEDLFGDELLEALAAAEKQAEKELADTEKAVFEKPAEHIDEIEKAQDAEAPVRIPRDTGVGVPAQAQTETIGISKQELAAIVQSEVAKLLKAQIPPRPDTLAVEETEPNVALSAKESEKRIDETEETIEEQLTGPDEREDEEPPVEYLDRILIPDAEKELDLTITLPEKVEITALVEMVGKLLGLNYIYDEKQVKGDVMLKVHDGKVKVKDAYALLESVLKFRGFVMTRRGKLVTIVPEAQALDYDPTLRISPQDIQPGDVIVTSIFDLQFVDTASAENLLKSMKLGTIINSIPENGTLIVTGYAYRMARIEEILKMIDVPGETRKFQFRQLQYTFAADLLPKIKTFAEKLGTVSVSVSVSTTAAPPSRKPQTAAQRRAAARRTAQRRTTTQAQPGAPAEEVVFLDADERTNRVLMIGTAEDIDLVNELIDALDVEKPDRRIIKEYEIQHVDPTQILDTLGELGVITGLATRGASQRRPVPSRTAARKTPAQAAPTTTGEPLEEEPQISVLPATNSILVNALPAQHTIIALVIAHVDRELEEATLPYVVYPLENQDPQELSDVLAKLIEKTTRAKAAAAAPDAKVQTRPTASTIPSKLEEEITIVADPKTYSLIVYASKKNQQWIGSLIRQLDEYRPQVLLDVTLVEITKTDDFNYDLGILSSIPDLTNTSGLVNTIVNAEGDEVFTSDNVLSSLLAAPDRNKFIDLRSDSGNFTGFYGDEKVNILLTAMQTKKYGRILAKPKLLVDDNQQGTIETKSTTYITRTTSSTQIPDTGSPFTSTDIKFEPYDASIKLDIKPHISKGNNLRLEIILARSDFVNLDPASTKPPDQAASDVTTVVTVPDGSTIILGGMDKINQSKGGDKVPILGDIPLVGGLFRKTSNTNAQSKLYIFVKAHILRPGTDLTSEELIDISVRNRNEFENTENEMQKYEDWPGIKPGVMEPLHILEADEPRTE